MKMEPFSKPIRIRIKIGTEEYSNISGIRDNFSLTDLYPLYLDGRLSRWLSQIGEDHIAERANEMLSHHAGNSLDDQIHFMSLFYPEIERGLIEIAPKANANGSLLSQLLPLLNGDIRFLCIKEICNNPTCMFSGEDILTIDNVDLFLKYRDTSSMLFKSPDSFGICLTKLIETEQDFKEIIRQLCSVANTGINCTEIAKSFCEHSSRRGWGFYIFTIDELIGLFSNPAFQTAEINWGKLFSNFNINDTLIFEKIEQVLSVHEGHRQQFYAECARKGHTIAKSKIDPWLELAEHIDQVRAYLENDEFAYEDNDHIIVDDFYLVRKALIEWTGSKCDFSKKAYYYSEIRNGLVKEIMDFLYYLHFLHKNSFLTPDSLKKITDMMPHLCQEFETIYYWKSEIYNSTQTDFTKILLKDHNSHVAKYLIDNPYCRYNDMASFCVNDIKKRLHITTDNEK